MDTIQNINEVIYSTHKDVIRRKKNPLIPILVTVAGLALTIWSLGAESLITQANLASGLMFLGLTLSIAGAILTVKAFLSSVPVYGPGKERLYRSERFFDPKHKRALCEALESGRADEVAKLPHSETSGVVLTLWATRSGSFTLAQVAEYVPHRFEPVTEVFSFTQEQAKSILAMA